MKIFIPLENNPSVMSPLAHTLGLTPALAFHDIYSLHDAGLLSFIPRPVYALVTTIPITPASSALRTTEDALCSPPYNSVSPSEPIIWFKQTIGHACGLIALLHACLNINPPSTANPAANPSPTPYLQPSSELHRLHSLAPTLPTLPRAKLLEDSALLETAHRAAAARGDTSPPSLDEAEHLGNHFIAFVRGRDGHLWELEGGREGPIDRGVLGDGEDLLSPEAVEKGIGRYMALEREAEGGELRFSALALGPCDV